jgi:uncharacterized protein with NRDE domain
LVVAANRDEFYSRPTAEPRVIALHPWVAAGQDLTEGGTWLGTNEHGMIVGILNRRNPNGPDPRRRSRGLLCLEALQAGSKQEVFARLLKEKGNRYNWFNLLVADREGAWIASNVRDEIRLTELSPGLHLLTNLNVDDPTCPRIAKSQRLFQAVELSTPGGEPERLLRDLRTILSDHSVPLDPRMRGPLSTLCIHTPGYGTRSSSVLIYMSEKERVRYWHASGPPCENEFTEVPLPDSRFAGQGPPE